MSKRSKKKTHRGMAKRFKVSKHGQIKGSKGGYSHKNMKKRPKRVRQARRGTTIQGRFRTKYLPWLGEQR